MESILFKKGIKGIKSINELLENKENLNKKLAKITIN